MLDNKFDERKEEMDTLDDKYFVTAKQLNQGFLRVSMPKLYEILHRAGCPKIQIGRKYLIPVAEFLEWFKAGMPEK